MAARGTLAGLVAVTGVVLWACGADRESGGAAGSGGFGAAQSGAPSMVTAGSGQAAGVGGSPPTMSGSSGTGGSSAGSGEAGASGSEGVAGMAGANAGAGDSGGAGAAGSPDVPCDPADETGPPEVIDFVATEYANFEVGAINFEPDAVTGMDTPNTGPYQPLIEVYPDFDQFTIYRPTEMDKPLQVIAWGNGGCAKHGTLHGDFLKESRHTAT
jgi:hypothetical protein